MKNPYCLHICIYIFNQTLWKLDKLIAIGYTDIGGGSSNEGRVSSLERPPPPPHSHSVTHNVGNLLHMAGSFSLCEFNRVSIM